MGAKKKTFTLRGAAAAAFAKAKAGVAPKTAYERAMLLAVLVYLNMQLENDDVAVGLIECVEKYGIADTIKAIGTTAKKEPSPPLELVCEHGASECKPCKKPSCTLCRLAERCACTKRAKGRKGRHT